VLSQYPVQAGNRLKEYSALPIREIARKPYLELPEGMSKVEVNRFE